MTLPRHLTQHDLEQAFLYDPNTGLITWRLNTRRTRAGDEAGTVTPRKRVVLAYKGEKLPAENVAWALVYGAWPKTSIGFVNGDAQDLRLANLQPSTKTFSTKPAAIAMRKKREKQKAAEAAALAQRAQFMLDQLRDEYPSISWSDADNAFKVTEPATMPVKAPIGVPQRRVIGKAETIEDAIALLEQHIQWIDLLNQGVPDLPGQPDSKPGRQGSFAITLADILDTVGYDPETGAFLARFPLPLYGFRVDKPFLVNNPRGPRYVYIKGQKLYCHMLAWFFSTGEWPRPKSIGWKNGNESDNSFANLYLKDQTP